MPTYEYKCEDCGKIFEELQSFSEPPIDKCIYCGGKSNRLVSGGAGIIFKGSGFYVNDSKKNGNSSGSSKSTLLTSSEQKSCEAPSTSDNKSNSSPEKNSNTETPKPAKQEVKSETEKPKNGKSKKTA